MDKAIRVLNFSGKQNDWVMWEAKYKARARMKGWLQVLLGQVASSPRKCEFDGCTSS